MYLDIKKVNHFHDVEYNNFNQPVLVSGGCKDMMAVKTWDIDRLRDIIKDNLIQVEVYHDQKSMGDTDCQYKLIRFDDFLEHSINDKMPYYYFAEYSIDKFKKQKAYDMIKNDIKFSFDQMRECDNELLYMGLNTLSGCHLHVEDDFVLNQIIEKKTVYLFNYYDNPQLKMRSFMSSNNNFLKMNFNDIDHNKVKLYKVILNPGDSLIIPPWWFHAVKGHQYSCSITKIYKRTDLEYYYKYKYLGFKNCGKTLCKSNYYKTVLYTMLIILIVEIHKEIMK